MLAPPPNYAPGKQQKDSIVEQLDRLLAHPVFKNSKRCPIFLRHVVERTLQGETDHPLKERSIGIEVFGREAGYDTNHDPIVRTTAGEVRKRIAQYYHEPGHETEIRIELPPGSYVPEFFFPPGVSEEPSAVAHSRAPGAPVWLAPKWRVAMWCLAGLVLSLAIVFSGTALERSRLATSRAVLDEFWGPILNSSAPAILCIGQLSVDTVQAGPRQDEQKTVSEFVRTPDHIALSDGMALVDLAGFLSKRGKTYRVQGSAATSLTDLRQGSVILIAGFDNSWTMRAIDPLRFHFVHGSSGPNIFSIQDRENPSRNDWSVNYDTPYARVTEDFAIIARFVDSVSDQTAVVAAGIGENGTISAGEFLTNARFLEQIAARAPRDWAHKNLEAVIVTQVIDEKSGPPRLLAVHFW